MGFPPSLDPELSRGDEGNLKVSDPVSIESSLRSPCGVHCNESLRTSSSSRSHPVANKVASVSVAAARNLNVVLIVVLSFLILKALPRLFDLEMAENCLFGVIGYL